MDSPLTPTEQPNLSERAIDSLTDARHAVLTATREVADVGNHFRDAIRKQRPNAFAEFIRDCTRGSPLTMLGIAFVAGVMVSRR